MAEPQLAGVLRGDGGPRAAAAFTCNECSVRIKVLSYILISIVWGGPFAVIGIWKCGLLCLLVYLFQCYVLPVVLMGVHCVRSGQWPIADETSSPQTGKLEPSLPPAVATEVKQWEPRPYSLVSAELASPAEACSNEL